MKVTVRQLEKLNACDPQISLVAIHWGKSVEVTPETCAEAAALGLDVEWAAEYLLTDKQCAEFDAKCGPIHAEYWAKLRSIYAEYAAKRKPVDDESKAKRWQAFYEATQEEER